MIPHTLGSVALMFCAVLGFSSRAIAQDVGASTRPTVTPRGERAVFTISDNVRLKNPPRFGLNIEPPRMSHWSEEPWHNQWWGHPNLGPFTARTKGLASGGDADSLEALPRARGGLDWGLGYYDVFRDGFFDGGSAVVYRYENGKARVVREGKIKRFLASKEGENRVVFETPGEPIARGDEYVLTVVRNDVPAGTTRTWEGEPWLMAGFVPEPGREKRVFQAGFRMSIDSDAPPGGVGGAGSLRLEFPEKLGMTRLGNWLISGENPTWPRFKEGRTYVARVWMKQRGMPTGRVELRVASMKTATFDVTGEWKEFSVEFTGGEPKTKSAERLDLGTAEAGTLWVDNLLIFEKGVPEWGMYPEVIETLKRFRPSALRLWVLQQNSGFGRLLDDTLGPVMEGNPGFRELRGAASQTALGLHQQLELCEKVGAEPWIITSTLYSPEEYRNLMEYLAGPSTTPYGAKRARWGREKPWTEAFPRILIEPGNETWNGMFAPQGFSGRAAQYGMYAELMFQAMKASPHYVDEKFTFVVNGWVADTGRNGFGGQALRNAPSAEAVDIAYYLGGWDAVGVMKADDPATGWWNILTYYQRMLRGRAATFKQTADAIAKESGRAVESMVYEAGPGYTLPGPGKFNMAEQVEGKSMAQAVNSLDSFMTNLAMGYGEQSFFMFRNSHYWSSHNRTWGEHIAYKALAMRNALLEGDLVTATQKQNVFVDLPEAEAVIVSQSNSADRRQRKFPALPNVPLVEVYPFRDGDAWSVMLISRRFDGPTPVTLELPFTPAPGGTLHTLRADTPDAHNIEREVVTVKETALPASAVSGRMLNLTLAPYSVTVVKVKADRAP